MDFSGGWELGYAEMSSRSFLGTFYEPQMVAYMPLERSQIDLSRLKNIKIFGFFHKILGFLEIFLPSPFISSLRFSKNRPSHGNHKHVFLANPRSK